MNDKTDYKATLKALDMTGTIASILNRLGEIAVETDDNQLEQMILATAKAVRDQREKSSTKLRLLSIPNSFPFGKMAEVVKATAKYCSSCKDAAEPQWQILALRAGWTPPPKIPAQ